MVDLKEYSRSELRLSMSKAHTLVFVFLIPMILLYGIPFYLFNINLFHFENPQKLLNTFNLFITNKLIWLLVVLIIGAAVHEFLHGLVWAYFAKNGFASIKIGIIYSSFTPFCHCKEPLLAFHYIIGTLTPFLLLGFIPAIVSIIVGEFLLLIVGIFFSITALGDLLVVFMLRNIKWTAYVQDHPSEIGCDIYQKT
jgi:hypothetical protein